MRILVGYESVMGNTRLVAEAVAVGLRRAAPVCQVECVHVSRLPSDLPAVDLLVLGAPTHLRGLPADRTRRTWVRGVVEASRREEPVGRRQLEPGAAGPGLREWLAGLPAPRIPPDADLLDAASRQPPPVRGLAAVFDTRLDRPFAGGSARSLARGLRRHGFGLLAPPEGFFVRDMGGPLRHGEVGRAQSWGEALADRVRSMVAY